MSWNVLKWFDRPDPSEASDSRQYNNWLVIWRARVAALLFLGLAVFWGLVVFALFHPELLEDVLRVAAVLLAAQVFVVLQIRRARGLVVWNGRTRDVYFRDSVISATVLVGTGSVLLGFDFSEVRAVFVCASMLLVHRVTFKRYRDLTVETWRTRGDDQPGASGANERRMPGSGLS